jgi:3-keto-disaccharide hydrolase
MSFSRSLLSLLSLLCATFAMAAEPAATMMTERGKLLFSDDLDKPLGKAWRLAKGKWEATGGALTGTELKADKHGAVIRHAQPFRNAVIQFSFKLDGAKLTTLSINTAKAHLCRVLIRPDGFSVRKDDSDKQGPDKAVVFETRKVAIKPGEWHTLVVELQGKEMLACLDGKEVAFGSHEALDTQKANLGLTVAGDSVSFKNLRVWEATPNKNWAATRARLTAARPKPPAPK